MKEMIEIDEGFTISFKYRRGNIEKKEGFVTTANLKKAMLEIKVPKMNSERQNSTDLEYNQAMLLFTYGRIAKTNKREAR